MPSFTDHQIFTVKVTGRARHLAEPHPVTREMVDHSDMVVTYLSPKLAVSHNHELHLELADAPDAVATLPNGVSMPLKEWLEKCSDSAFDPTSVHADDHHEHPDQPPEKPLHPEHSDQPEGDHLGKLDHERDEKKT